ncbi:MAG: exodeoxyribonuclease VII large subunit [Herminiimonas sp.]|nr:exodeoxyribonuclease VII large subunit [Herminiimonas sp.]
MISDPAQPAAAGTPQVISVSGLNQAVARLLERSFPLAWVSGEVSNFTRAASGHWYFTLKDDGAQVRAVMFRGRAQYADLLPKEGDRVEVRALVTLYAARGDYQLGVEAIRRAGVGNLYEAFLQLKARLEAEGLFDPARKRPVPHFVRHIGIVTSPQAAALHDVLTTLARRAPHCHVIVYPTPVQGAGAGEKIAAAIAIAAARHECDLLLVCRGGGSIEDLWAFNHEAVARAIVACPMPVISGVGHETDVTIADFAADLRAPTPTAAAELATRPLAEWLAQVVGLQTELQRAWRRQHAERTQTLDWLARRLISPQATIRHEGMKLQALQQRLSHATQIPLASAGHALQRLAIRLANQLPDATAPRLQVADRARRLAAGMSVLQQQRRQALAHLSAQLDLLDPQRTLERGYAIVTDARGAIVRSPQALHARAVIGVRLADGSAQVGIASVQASIA